MDESWVYYDPELKEQSKEWLPKKAPRPIKAICTRATGKVMIVTFFDSRGMIYYKFTRQGIGAQVFIAICTRFLEAYQTRHPQGRIRGRLFLHMNNAPAHTANVTKAFLQRHSVQLIPHPPYSPDLAPNDFWFYGELKKPLRGQRFPTLEHLKQAVTDRIAEIPSHDYAEAILRSWPQRILRCIGADGGYFEGIVSE